MFGDIKAEQIVVPYEPGRMKTKQDELTKSLLSGLELGISIFLDKRSIYIHRRCKYVITRNGVMWIVFKVGL